MKPVLPLTDPRFDYTPAARTDVRDTWRKAGWSPVTGNQTRSEVIVWERPETPPNGDQDVLVCVAAEASWTGERETWMGYYDDGQWRGVNGEPITITAWAALPGGPTC